MLDVHPPHKAIHGTGEFFLHLFTITVGLLIAVGIEGAVERHQHTELAEQAQATMNAEIRKNEVTMTNALKDIERERQLVDRNLESIAKVQNDPGQDANVDVSYSSSGLEDTAWRTAQATGALSYMPYDRAEKYSSIYNAEHDFLVRQQQLGEDEAQFLGTIRRYHVGKGKMGREAADAFAERLGIWQGHLLTLSIAARVLEEQQSAFLQGREPRHNLSEKLSD